MEFVVHSAGLKFKIVNGSSVFLSSKYLVHGTTPATLEYDVRSDFTEGVAMYYKKANDILGKFMRRTSPE